MHLMMSLFHTFNAHTSLQFNAHCVPIFSHLIMFYLCCVLCYLYLDWTHRTAGTRGDAELIVDINCELLNVKAGERSKL